MQQFSIIDTVYIRKEMVIESVIGEGADGDVRPAAKIGLGIVLTQAE